MDLEYCNDGSVEVLMKQYLLEAIEEFYDEITISSIFILSWWNCHTSLLKRTTIFHKIVAKILFVCYRGMSDTQAALLFLTSRISKPNDVDSKKLKRLLQYIKGTLGLLLKLPTTSTAILKWWIDTVYGVHNNMCSHTWTNMLMGLGSIYSRSTKQKINSKSLTEAKLVEATDGSVQHIIDNICHDQTRIWCKGSQVTSRNFKCKTSYEKCLYV